MSTPSTPIIKRAMRATFVGIIATTLVLIGVLIGAAWSALNAASTSDGTIWLSPCATEDSDNCYWDASTRGNDEGVSFITFNGVTYYAGLQLPTLDTNNTNNTNN